jgi:hypothetical protein
MLALKKKREVEKKEKEEAAKREAAAALEEPSGTAPADGGQVSLFGIGGQKKTKKGEASGIRKSPGEIRIQKGNLCIPIFSFSISKNDSSVSNLPMRPP